MQNHAHDRTSQLDRDGRPPDRGTVGKKTLTAVLRTPSNSAHRAPTAPGRRPVQMLSDRQDSAYAEAALCGASLPADLEQGANDTHAIAERGLTGSSGRLPHLDTVQRAFGRHDVTNVRTFSDGDAQRSAHALGARAYATGDSVALGSDGADLHTVAHEAAHVVQQRGGVSLKAGVGSVGDAYEQHADEVADLVVQGQSAEALLDRTPGGSGSGVQSAVQLRITSRRSSVQVDREGTADQQLEASDTAVAGAVRQGQMAGPDLHFSSAAENLHSQACTLRDDPSARAQRTAPTRGPGDDTDRPRDRQGPNVQLRSAIRDDIQWYEEHSSQANDLENLYQEANALLAQSRAAWARCGVFMNGRGVDASEGTTLDAADTERHAGDLEVIHDRANIRQTAPSSHTMDSATHDYAEAWRAVRQAKQALDTQMYRDRSAATQAIADRANADLARYQEAIDGVEQAISTISSIHGSITTMSTEAARHAATISEPGATAGPNGEVVLDAPEARIENGRATPRDEATRQSGGSIARDHARAVAGTSLPGILTRLALDGPITDATRVARSYGHHSEVLERIAGARDRAALFANYTDALDTLGEEGDDLQGARQQARIQHGNYGSDMDDALQRRGDIRGNEESGRGYMLELSTIRECRAFTQQAAEPIRRLIERARTFQTEIQAFASGRSQAAVATSVRQRGAMHRVVTIAQRAPGAIARLNQEVTHRLNQVTELEGRYGGAVD